MNINELSKQIYAQNKAVGWWDNPDRCILQTMQLVSTELAEATEGERKQLMDDHLPHRYMAEVELADALIRVLDIGGRFEWEYDQAVPAHWFMRKATNPAAMHLACNMALCELAVAWVGPSRGKPTVCYSQLINTILQTALLCRFDIEGALTEKSAYNAKRADHKRENRAAANGKKF